MKDLRAACEDLGFTSVRTLLASGNVLLESGSRPEEVRGTLEAGLEERFGFPVGVVLRTREELEALVAANPFGGREEDRDTKLYVTFLAEPEAHTLPLPCREPGDFEVVHVTDREVFVVAYRMESGRFGPGRERVGKHFEGRTLWTVRNWNTVRRAMG